MLDICRMGKRVSSHESELKGPLHAPGNVCVKSIVHNINKMFVLSLFNYQLNTLHEIVYVFNKMGKK